MRDIISYYKTGRFVHATRAWCDGVELQLDAAVATPELPDLDLLDVQTDGCGSQYVCCKCSRATAECMSYTGERWFRTVLC